MNEIVRVVVDAMGGDNAPGEIVKGAVAAANKHEDIHLILTGLKDAVENELKKYTYPADRIEVVPTTQVIETAEPPVAAIRTKKDSSIVVGPWYAMDRRMHLSRPEALVQYWSADRRS